MFLSKGLNGQEFTAAGTIRVPGADISGQLTFRGARLACGRGCDALVADGSKVSGSVFLDEGFTAAGAIRLIGADITGQLSCSDAHLNGADSDGAALVADWIKVGLSMLLDKGFTAAGTISLDSGRVGRGLVWAPEEQFSGRVDLARFDAGHLEDDWGSGRPGSSRARAASTARSVQSGLGRATCRPRPRPRAAARGSPRP
jgi:hypothetical protein